MTWDVRPTKWVSEQLDELSRPELLGLCFTILSIVGGLDFLVVTNWSLTPLYLLHVAIAAWFLGPQMAIALAVLGVAVSAAALVHAQGTLPDLSLLWNSTLQLGVLVVFIFLLRAVRISKEFQRQLSRLDPITGAINRRFFLELLEAEFARAERYHFPLTLIYLNVRNFSQSKDDAGADAANSTLCQLIEGISDTLRANDVVSRIGDNDFMVLLPQTNDQQSRLVFNRLQPFLTQAEEDEEVPLLIQAGVKTFLTMPDTAEDLVAHADALREEISASQLSGVSFDVYDEPSLLDED